MTLAERMNMQMQPAPQPRSKQINVVLHMPEVAGLIRHLDMLYTKLIISNQQSSSQPMVEILGKPYIQTKSWFNQGQL